MPDIQYPSIGPTEFPAKKSGPITYTHDFDHKNVLDSEIHQTLGTYYNHIVFDPSSRTIWHEGVPYGTAYQFNDSSGHFNNDVFGDINSHQVSGNNNVMMGSCNQTGHQTQNGLFIGTYNKCDDSSYSYIFTIGNGDGNNNRSNLLAIHKAKDSTDRTQTSLIGYLNVEHLKSNISDSYVSSLGKSATADIILKALLTPADYYKPSGFSFTLTNLTQNIECGYAISPIRVSKVTLPTKMSKWDYTYIATYIKNNTTLPSDVHLSDLGYAWTFCNQRLDCTWVWWTDNKNDSSKYIDLVGANQVVKFDGTKLNTFGSFTFSSVKRYTPHPSTVSPNRQCNIADINADVTLHKSAYYGGDIVIDFANVIINKPGKYQCGQSISSHVCYTVPQLSYFKQLVDNGVYVVSDKNAWTTVRTSTYKVNDNFCTIYTGYKFYYGLCHADAGSKQEKDFFKQVLTGIDSNNKADKTPKIIKSDLTTPNMQNVLNSDISYIKYYTNLFGKDVAKQYNCAFICFPAANLLATPDSSDSTKYWYYKSGPGDPESTLSGDPTDPKNYDYTFEDSSKLSKYNITWRVIACKSTNNFAMSNDTDGWYGLKINVKPKF